MTYNITDALLSLTPGAQWVLRGDEYSGLEWLDETQTKPTEEEVVQKIAELTYQKEVEVYKQQRAAEYPSYADQFDKIYHSGVNAWKSQIRSIKDKYPKQTMDADVLQTRKDAALSELQKQRYLKAVERLDQYILSEGLPEIREDVVIRTEEVWNQRTEEFEEVNVTDNVLVQSGIDPLPATVIQNDPETGEEVAIRNPLIVKDEEERAAAQAVIDATPQSVIDAINS